eukprot:283171-Chlamydomonas_euryale.AAC.2
MPHGCFSKPADSMTDSACYGAGSRWQRATQGLWQSTRRRQSSSGGWMASRCGQIAALCTCCRQAFT